MSSGQSVVCDRRNDLKSPDYREKKDFGEKGGFGVAVSEINADSRGAACVALNGDNEEEERDLGAHFGPSTERTG